jgi:hypothetical protein
MKRLRKKDTRTTVATRQTDRRSPDGDKFARVLCELEAVGKTRHDADPLVEQLRKCPETFAAGEMLCKIFDNLKYNRTSSENDERLIPPAGVVLPLV